MCKIKIMLSRGNTCRKSNDFTHIKKKIQDVKVIIYF